MDVMKIKYYMRKIQEKRSGRLYRVLRRDIVSNNTEGFVGDVRKLCEKYSLPEG